MWLHPLLDAASPLMPLTAVSYCPERGGCSNASLLFEMTGTAVSHSCHFSVIMVSYCCRVLVNGYGLNHTALSVHRIAGHQGGIYGYADKLVMAGGQGGAAGWNTACNTEFDCLVVPRQLAGFTY